MSSEEQKDNDPPAWMEVIPVKAPPGAEGLEGEELLQALMRPCSHCRAKTNYFCDGPDCDHVTRNGPVCKSCEAKWSKCKICLQKEAKMCFNCCKPDCTVQCSQVPRGVLLQQKMPGGRLEKTQKGRLSGELRWRRSVEATV